jgi:hypothetical protein
MPKRVAIYDHKIKEGYNVNRRVIVYEHICFKSFVSTFI